MPLPPDLLAILGRVASCPDRGDVLPHTRQREGCKGCELTRCHAGKGDPPGAVTLEQCVGCVTTEGQT